MTGMKKPLEIARKIITLRKNSNPDKYDEGYLAALEWIIGMKGRL